MAEIEIAAAAITAGATLIGKAITADGGPSVVCAIQTENWTKFIMKKPKAISGGGLIEMPPVEILPGIKEAMVAHKGGGATGSYGSVSWIVKDRRVVIMWSAPYNFDFYHNWMAVGITKPGYTEHKSNWYDIMYSGENTAILSFKRKEFYNKTATVTISDGLLEISGIMGSTHKTTVNVEVKPRKKDDYAPSVKKALGIDTDDNYSGSD